MQFKSTYYNLYGIYYIETKLSFIYLANQRTFDKQLFNCLPAASEAMTSHLPLTWLR